jgi:hypothetical protein
VKTRPQAATDNRKTNATYKLQRRVDKSIGSLKYNTSGREKIKGEEREVFFVLFSCFFVSFAVTFYSKTAENAGNAEKENQRGSL